MPPIAIPAEGAKFFRSFFFWIFKIFDIGDVGGRRPGVGDPKPGSGGKSFPIFFLIFKIFDIGDVGGRTRTPARGGAKVTVTIGT